MTVQQAIEHAKKVAEEKYAVGMLCHANPNDEELDSCIECAKEHEMLASWLEELQEYKSIGTVEDCKNAMEKQDPKKPIRKSWEVTKCPACGANLGEWLGDGYTKDWENKTVCDCGQQIDWS